MPTEQPETMACCPPMALLKEPERYCNIELDEEGKLTSCDDDGDRLPPINYCPWCGTKLDRKEIHEQHDNVAN